jgi:hypothetical protein
MSNDRLLGGPPRGAREGRPAERAWEALPPAPAGAVTIWRGADGRGGMGPLASTRRPELLCAAWPFGPGRFYFLEGPRQERLRILLYCEGRWWQELAGWCTEVGR